MKNHKLDSLELTAAGASSFSMVGKWLAGVFEVVGCGIGITSAVTVGLKLTSCAFDCKCSGAMWAYLMVVSTLWWPKRVLSS